MSKKEDLKNINKELENKTTIDVIAYFLDNFKNVALSSSLAAEDQVLTDILLKKKQKCIYFYT